MEGNAELGGDLGRGQAAGEQLHRLLAAEAGGGTDERGHGEVSSGSGVIVS
jgi:hypothetical protein